jgi:hypothetical protein
MRIPVAALLAAVLLSPACSRAPAVEATSAGTIEPATVPSDPPTVVPAGTRWAASLTPRDGSGVTGVVSARVTGIDQLDVDVSVAGAPPGRIHPWHVHRGTCDADQGIVGPPAAYPPLATGGDGRARLLATVPVTFERGQPYVVDVHRSSSEMRVVVACGLLEVGE